MQYTIIQPSKHPLRMPFLTLTILFLYSYIHDQHRYPMVQSPLFIILLAEICQPLVDHLFDDEQRVSSLPLRWNIWLRISHRIAVYGLVSKGFLNWSFT